VARIEDGLLVLDVRTVSDDELPLLARGLAHALREIQKEGGNDGVGEIERDHESDDEV
jgi:hypothetical protein